jgi:hypothetical protein
MTTQETEDFKRFVLEHRDLIESILHEEDGNEAEEKAVEDPIEQTKEEAKDKVKDVNGALLAVLSDENVQKYFVAGCLDLMHLFKAIVEAAPLSPEVRETVENFESASDSLLKTAAVSISRDKIENITVKEAKDQTSASVSSRIEKLENMSINSLKEEVRKRLD